MYLYSFAMKKIPFGHTPDTALFCATKTHIEAMNVLLFSINSGEAFCKITGEVGSGKTMLCRLLIRKLEKRRNIAYIPNPNLSVKSLHYALAKELGLRVKADCREDQLSQSIQSRLIKLNKLRGPVVLIIDEAQVLPDTALEALRLFTNIETEQQKLLQIVLFGQPELDKKLRQKKLRQLKQRISFSYRIKPLTPFQVGLYINHRLSVVSTGVPIRTSEVCAWLVHYFSKGTPRLVNILCHKALMLAYPKNKKNITLINIIKSALDTEGVDRFLVKHLKLSITLILLSISTSTLAFWSVV